MTNAARASLQYHTDADRWAAVHTRDHSADGRFFYAVRTTGVVCRPGCGSRAPRRRNVTFFTELADALRDGYRPCKRCRPGNAGQARVPVAVIEACRMIESADGAPSLVELGEALAMAPSRLRRQFRKTLGVTPKEYAEALKAQRFRGALERDESVTTAVYAAGYGSASRAYARAPGQLGMTPAQYKDGARGLRVEYLTSRCRLGAVAIAATDKGICAVELGDRCRELAERITTRFVNASLASAGGPLREWIEAALRRIDAPGTGAGLPLDIQGTAFQLKVWRALAQIPAGQTRSYKEVATTIGRPRAARAVARACASNSLAVLVPCHRVVRSDGDLSGYRWGVERKRRLLDAEAEVGEGSRVATRSGNTRD